MNKLNTSKKEFARKVGKKWFLDDDICLPAILNYNYGIKYFDEILNGKTIKQFNAVIHFNLFPKGYVITIAKLFSSFSYPLPFNDIKVIVFVEKENFYELNIDTVEETLSFYFKKDYFNEILNFVKKSKVNYKIKHDSNSKFSNNVIKKDNNVYNKRKRKTK